MSSAEFKSILDNALAIVAIRSRGLSGLDQTIAEIRRKVQAAVSPNESSRERFVEPWSDSQRLEVPFETVEAVVIELHRLGVLHIWVRVKCPNADDQDDCILFETDKPETFQRQLDESCRHCGQIHDNPSWDSLETVYAINLDDPTPRDFDFSRFFANPRPSERRCEPGRMRR